MLQPNRNEEGTERRGFGAYSMTLLAVTGRGQMDGRRTRTDGRKTRHRLPHLLPRPTRDGKEKLRARIHIASPSSGGDVASRRGSSPSDFCIRGGAVERGGGGRAEDTFPGRQRKTRVAHGHKNPGSRSLLECLLFHATRFILWFLPSVGTI